MKLFVDDLRSCPKGWTPARTITEAIRILDTRKVSEVSLDYDIQLQTPRSLAMQYTSPETFEPVVRFVRRSDLMAEGLVVRIHTSNFEGGRRMSALLGVRYVPYIYNEDDYK